MLFIILQLQWLHQRWNVSEALAWLQLDQVSCTQWTPPQSFMTLFPVKVAAGGKKDGFSTSQVETADSDSGAQ